MNVALATTVFAAVHSLLATRGVKSAAQKAFPRGRERYRLFYNAQGIVTFTALVSYIAAQPKRTLYHVTGIPAILMRIAQTSGIAFAVAAARATGITKLAGIEALHPPVEREATIPAAQGPERGIDGNLRVRGPFTVVRHPLNLAPLAPFWLTPHMTTRRLAFNVVATVYLIAGSRHEEIRLLEQYGDDYERYRRSGVPFYFPRLRRRASAPPAPVNGT
ncbi:MAG TPA: NnrU family protein [Thermoanaerobaculia bacterium]